MNELKQMEQKAKEEIRAGHLVVKVYKDNKLSNILLNESQNECIKTIARIATGNQNGKVREQQNELYYSHNLRSFKIDFNNNFKYEYININLG